MKIVETFRNYVVQKRLLRSLNGRCLRPDELKPEMKVCVVKSSTACILQVSGMPVIVKAVDAPFLVVEIERAIMDMPRMMSGGEPSFVKQSITINAFKALFIKVSDEYVQAARMRTSEPSQTEFPDVIS